MVYRPMLKKTLLLAYVLLNLAACTSRVDYPGHFYHSGESTYYVANDERPTETGQRFFYRDSHCECMRKY
jgi:hypothetical protein